jgi:hypothetical protein
MWGVREQKKKFEYHCSKSLAALTNELQKQIQTNKRRNSFVTATNSISLAANVWDAELHGDFHCVLSSSIFFFSFRSTNHTFGVIHIGISYQP